MLFNSILETTKNTPLVRINPFYEKQAKIFLKLEWFTMGGSTKDRVALKMIEDAEKSGSLRKGMTIIEASSGNTAIGLAIASIHKGYRFVAVCDEYLPQGKRNRLLALGAELITLPLTPKGEDTVEIRIEMAKKLVTLIPNSITLNQFANQSNVEAHIETTGPEIWNDLNGDIDACVVFCGTCGSVSGIGSYLKKKNPKIKIYAVEHVGSIIFGGTPGTYLISGGGLSFTPSILDRAAVDHAIHVSDHDAFWAARQIAIKEGLMIGSTGGGVLSVALQVARELGNEKNIVAVMPDIGDRYMDSVFSDSWLKENSLEKTIPTKENDISLLIAAQKIGCKLTQR